jgi:hypothetical protein
MKYRVKSTAKIKINGISLTLGAWGNKNKISCQIAYGGFRFLKTMLKRI